MDLSAIPGAIPGPYTRSSVRRGKTTPQNNSQRRFLGAALAAASFLTPAVDVKAQTPTAITSPATANQKQEKSSDLTRLLDEINTGNLKESSKEALHLHITEVHP